MKFWDGSSCRYGKFWKLYCDKVPYRIIPGIYWKGSCLYCGCLNLIICIVFWQLHSFFNHLFLSSVPLRLQIRSSSIVIPIWWVYLLILSFPVFALIEIIMSFGVKLSFWHLNWNSFSFPVYVTVHYYDHISRNKWTTD